MTATIAIHPTLERQLAERAAPILLRLTPAQRERAVRALVSSLNGVSTVRVLRDGSDGGPEEAA